MLRVVEAEASRRCSRHQPGRVGEAGRKPIEPHDLDVRDRKDPAALIAIRVVEHVQLARMQPTDIRFLMQ